VTANLTMEQRMHNQHVTDERTGPAMVADLRQTEWVSGIVVVGGGIAGQTVCEAVRDRDREVPLTLLSAEPYLPYDRVNLSNLLAPDAPAQDLGNLQLRPAEWYGDNRVDVVLGCTVSEVDLAARTLALSDGAVRSFERLVLATGSTPLLPSVAGIDLENVHAYRTPQDCEAIREAARGARRAVVIGGGLLGLEAARGIQSQGCPVTVVHLLDRLMERQLDAGSARMLLPAMEELGIAVMLERETERLVGDAQGRVRAVRFTDGEELEADLVVVSIGIRPEISLARGSGLTCDRGVMVDDRMRSSEPGVVAVGECAQHNGVVHGLVAPIFEQARVAADTLLNREGPDYRGSVPWARLKVAGIDLVSIGSTQAGDGALSSDELTRTYRRLAVRDGRITGAILLGDTRGTEALLDAVRTAEEVPDPLARLAALAQAGPADLADDAQVCDCNGVCKGEITRAVIEEGLGSVQDVMRVTRAGTGCGSCKPLVAELVSLAGGSDAPAYLCACRRQTRGQLAERIIEGEMRSVSEVSEACETGRECGLCKPALAYLVSEINDNRHREERSARHINDRVHANVQNDGTFSVVPRMRGGVTTSDQLRRIADAADKYQVRMIKVTGSQRIDLLGVRKEDLPDIWRDIGMPSGHAYGKAVRMVKSCVGTDFCRFGIGDSIALGIELETLWEGLHTPAKVKSGCSGCPRNCAEATVKDIGVVAVDGGWQIYIGGGAGSDVRKGDVLTTVRTPDEAKELATAFLQLYRENASFKERTYTFVPRFGLDEVKRRVLDDGSRGRLLERFRLAKTAQAALDPWLERDRPYHERQFQGLGQRAALDGDLVGPPPDGAR
jgi:nitrite reductase (NADH) large subunit